MEYDFHQLKNGLELGIAPLSGDKTVTVLLSFKVGSKHETKEKNGMAHFVEHMLFKGTKSRPQLTQMVREIERLGGYFNGFTVKEFTWFYIRLLKEDLEIAMDVLQDAVNNPLFDPNELEKEKQVILEEISTYNDSSEDLVDDLFEKCLYNDQSIAWPTLGSAENVKNFKNEDLIKFFREFYVVPNVVLTVAGGIDPTESLRLAEKYFSGLPIGQKIKEIKVMNQQTEPQILIRRKKIDQAQIALGARTFPLDHRDHYSAKLTAILLGGNMSSCLFKRLREELALVYDVETVSESRVESGYLLTNTGLKKENISQAVKEIVNEHKKFREQTVGTTELDDAKNFLLNKKRILFEDSSFVALDLAKRLIFKKRAVTFEQYQSQVEEVTPSDISRVAADIFKDENLNLAVVGPIDKKDEKEYRKILHF